MAESEWQPPSRHNIGLFHADHDHHGKVERIEIPYVAGRQWNVAGLCERWKPGAVFVVLRCSECKNMLVLDTVPGDEALPEGRT